MKKIKNYQLFLESVLLIKNKEFLDRQERERQEKNKEKVTKGTVGFVSSDKTKSSAPQKIMSIQGEMDDTQTQGEMGDAQTQSEMDDTQTQGEMDDTQTQGEM